MKKIPIESLLTESDQQILESVQMGTRAGFGSRPAIVVIDVAWAFTGDKREPVLESIKRWNLSCGEYAWDSLPAIKKVTEAGRTKGIPVIYLTYPQFRPDVWDAGSWAWKISAVHDDDSNGESATTSSSDLDPMEIHSDIEPQPQDIIIKKLKPSGFHGTPLQSFLTLLGADSLLVMGGVTSGCVRATVTDAFNENYRVAVIEEGVYDRFEASHTMSLFDMNAKYADIVSLDQTLEFIENLPENLFVLPGSK